MLGNDFWYFESIKKYIIAFSHLFKDIHVQRYDDEGTLIKDISIPISFGQKTKLFYMMENGKDRRIDTILPRIDFELNELRPDPTRQRNIVNQKFSEVVDENDDYISGFNGIAYNFSFSVSLICKYLSDLYQGLEQILSFFTPDYQNLDVNLIPELGIKPNIKIIMENVELDITQDLDSENFRTCEANFNFTLQGYLYKPLKLTPTIKSVIVGITDYDTNKLWSQLTSVSGTDTWVDYDQFYHDGD